MVTNQVLDAPAWQAMSHGARSLYVALKRRYWPNKKNNGRIYLSHRQARKELGRSSPNEIVRWFRELQHYGFIVMAAPGCLGVNGKGQAPRWRLTEVSYMRGTSSRGMEDMPLMDFMKWNGVRFQNPVTEIRNAPLRKSVTPPLRKSVTRHGTTVTEIRNKENPPTVTEIRNRSYKPCGAGRAGAFNEQQQPGRADEARPVRDIIDVRSRPR